MKAKSLYFFYVFLILICVCNAQSFEFPITVSNGKVSQTLVIGMHPFGSDNYDTDLDILAPPPPPAGAFDARLTVPDPPNDYKKDIRSTARDSIVFQIHFQLSAKDTSLTLTWDTKIPKNFHSMMLTDEITGEIFKLDMKMTNIMDISAEPLLIKSGSLRISIVKNEVKSQ